MSFPDYATSVVFNFEIPMIDDWVQTGGTPDHMWSSGGVGTDNGNSGGGAYFVGGVFAASGLMTAPQKEVLCTYAVDGGVGFGFTIDLLTTTNPNGLRNGYRFYVLRNSNEVTFDKVVAGTETPLSPIISYIPLVGDLFGISYDNTTLRAYTKRGAAAWTLLQSFNDSTFAGQNMYGALYSSWPSSGGNGGVGLDDFSIGSGAIVSPPVDPNAYTVVPKVVFSTRP